MEVIFIMENVNELVVVNQLPIITEQLQTVKAEVVLRVQEALALECTETTYKDVKKERAELNKMFKAFEDKRKEVKKAITEPYAAFEAVYKDCVSDIFTTADAELKKKIASVEDVFKKQKYDECKRLYDEEAVKQGCDFLKWENTGHQVNMSTNVTALMTECFVNIRRAADDVAMIKKLGDIANEVYVEYSNPNSPAYLRLNSAVEKVQERRAALKAHEEEEAKNNAEVEAINTEAVTVSPIITETAPTIEQTEEVYTVSFTVVNATKGQIIALKQFMKNNNIIFR